MSGFVTALYIVLGLVVAVLLMWIVAELQRRNRIVEQFAVRFAEFERTLHTIKTAVESDESDQCRLVAVLRAQLTNAGIVPQNGEAPTDERRGE